MEVDYNKIRDTIIQRGLDVMNLSYAGFIVTDEDICYFNSIVILDNSQYIDSFLNEKQKQKLITMFNELIILK